MVFNRLRDAYVLIASESSLTRSTLSTDWRTGSERTSRLLQAGLADEG